MTAPSRNRPQPLSTVPAEVFSAEGPIVSVYLTTKGALPDAAEQVAVRWRNVRRALTDGGAPDAALEAVEGMLDGAHAEGETLVVIANASGVLFSAHLDEPPDEDIAVVGPLPHLVPLIAARQRMIPYLVVATDRAGAEMIAVLPDHSVAFREVSGDDFQITRSAPGGWSQRRFQQRVENHWDANARLVADEVTRLVDATAPRLVVVSGDVRAVAFLREHLPARVVDMLVEVQGDYSSVDEALVRSQQLVSDLVARDTEEVMAALADQAGRSESLTEGPEAVLDALRDGRVETVVVDPSRATDATGWFGAELSQVAATADELRTLGVDHPGEAPLVDVIVRAAVATDAEVWVASEARLGASGGTAVTLRY